MQLRTFILAWAIPGLVVFCAASTSTYAADDCLSGPKSATPSGQHWYYRIDRATKKHCWYLGDHGTRVNKLAAKSTAAVAGTENAPTAPLDETVADARAELPSTNILPSANAAATTPSITVPPAEPGSGALLSNENTPRLTAHDLITQAPTTLASRLPLPNEFQPAEPQPDQTALTVQSARSEPSNQTSAPQSAGAHIGPMQIFLCALAIMLAFAAILGRVVFRYVADTSRKRAAPNRHRQIWPDDLAGGSRQPSYAQMITPERRARGARVEQDITEIERLLSSESQRLR